MKKVMFFIFFCSLIMVFNCLDLRACVIPYIEQQLAKKNMIFDNGKSYKDLEDELRLKHPNTPESIIVPGYGRNTEYLINKIINCSYAPNYFPLIYSELNSETGSLEKKEKWGHCLLIAEKTTEWNYDTALFMLSHEIGHSQFSNIAAIIAVSTNLAFFPIAYYWKKIIGTAPYKNRFTKYGSKIIAARTISKLAEYGLKNLEERRADNFAIKHSDVSMLQGGIQGFQESKEALQKEYSRNVLSKVLPFNIGWKLINPVHPSFDSRIAKIKTALKTRFNIEA